MDLRRSILANDGRVSLGYHVYPDIPLPALVVALNRRLTAATRQPPTPVTYPRGLPVDDERVRPNDVAMAVNDLFDRRDRIPIVADMGNRLFTALDIDNTELVAPGYYGTMGFGVPGGLGVQAASGRRPLVLVGDGAFRMTRWELLNCRRYGWNPISNARSLRRKLQARAIHVRPHSNLRFSVSPRAMNPAFCAS